MKLPKQSQPIIRSPFSIRCSSVYESNEVLPQAAASLPGAIATVLAQEYAVYNIDGFVQCVGTLAGILGNYERCLAEGRSGCAKIAARNIKNVACKSYCTCN